MIQEQRKDTKKVSENQEINKKEQGNITPSEVDLLSKITGILKHQDDRFLKSLLDKLRKKSMIEIAENYLAHKYEFRNNTIANRFEYREKDQESFQELNDNNLFVELQKNKVSLSQNNLIALLKSEFVPEHNPFLDYLERLPQWTANEPDYISNLANYTSVVKEDKKRFLYHFKKHLVRTVACALGHYANKQCLVFSGGQNNGKSTFIRFLLPPALAEYLAENIGTDKDSLIALTENFLINLDELSTLSKSDVNALKATFSFQNVKVRKPFDRKPTLAKRRANFFGSTNKREFLSDETGSVRWLCFDTKGSFNFEYSKVIDIDKVYAQAYSLFKEGFEYELTVQDIKENDKINQKYQIQTPEIEAISFMYKPISKEQYESNKHHELEYKAITSTDIKQELDDSYKQKFHTVNIGRALRYLGFEQTNMRREANSLPIKVWLVQYAQGKLHHYSESTNKPSFTKENENGYPESWDKDL